jgi:hypothetical protein
LSIIGIDFGANIKPALEKIKDKNYFENLGI